MALDANVVDQHGDRAEGVLVASLTRVRHAVELTTRFAGFNGSAGSSPEECLIILH
jgi:hypothetical protein